MSTPDHAFSRANYVARSISSSTFQGQARCQGHTRACHLSLRQHPSCSAVSANCALAGGPEVSMVAQHIGLKRQCAPKPDDVLHASMPCSGLPKFEVAYHTARRLYRGVAGACCGLSEQKALLLLPLSAREPLMPAPLRNVDMV